MAAESLRRRLERLGDDGGLWMLGIGAALVLFAFVAVRRREVGTV